MTRCSTIIVGVTAVLACVAPAANAQQQRPAIRFAEMDRNHDGVITRDEWRGSDRSFDVHDWNRDGRLSGDEVRLGAQREQPGPDDWTFDSPQREYQFDDWTPRGFRSLDHNRDNRITRDEWHFDRESFRRADHNRDGVITRDEFLSEDEDDDRGDPFSNLDANRDGRISRDEWHAGRRAFDALDDNHDGAISRAEMFGREAPPDLFASLDVNHDRIITRDEWHWSPTSFDARDLDRNGRLTREEFDGVGSRPAASAAYRAGQERGLAEGREAGRGDKQQAGVWDLEGQRELEQADSGYDPRLGPREEYQAGYREAFRRGYREGFGQR
jgi:Ca2+-binding EF-hand superfamily protein